MSILRTVILAGLLSLFFGASCANAASVNDARQFVDNVGQQVLNVVNSQATPDAKQEQLRNLFSQFVDMDWMGQFVLGRARQEATAAQRTRYAEAYRKYLMAIYTTNFSDYGGSRYVITSTQQETADQFLVGMQIKSPNARQQDIQAGYRVRNGNGQFKITDIIVEGLSLITTQRSEFSSVIQQKGLDGLIADLEMKTAGAAKP